jgi:hypothetical protein
VDTVGSSPYVAPSAQAVDPRIIVRTGADLVA